MNSYTQFYRLMTSCREAFAASGLETEENSGKLTIGYSVVKVDEKWLSAIEKGMKYVKKAIDEERRFIRSSGEVLPIEKVKKVSRESVAHLARHGELISQQQDGEDVVPDKLYTVERLNDYATYENRFLYKLLHTAKSFLSVRYSSVARAAATHSAKLSCKQTLRSANRNLRFALTLEEDCDDDFLLQTEKTLTRLDKVSRLVDSCLATPLMEELASDGDSIAPVINKNNVLKMDKNFKEAVRLYDFLISYEGEGFTVVKRKVNTDSAQLSAMIAAFTAFCVSFSLPDAEKAVQKAAEEEDAAESRRLLSRAGGDLESYALQLEKRSARLGEIEPRMAELSVKLKRSLQENDKLQREKAAFAEESASEKRILEEQISEGAQRFAEQQATFSVEKEQLLAQIERLEKENSLLKAQLVAYGGVTAQSAEEEFAVMEDAYEKLGSSLNSKWQGVKKELKKQSRTQLKDKLRGKTDKRQ